MTVNNWKMGTGIAIAIAIILGAMYMVTRGDLNQAESELSQVKSEFSALSDNYSTLSDKCDSILENLSKARSKLTAFREVFVCPELILSLPDKEELPEFGPWRLRLIGFIPEVPDWIGGVSTDWLKAYGFKMCARANFKKSRPWTYVNFAYIAFESARGAEAAIDRWKEEVSEAWREYEVYSVTIGDESFGYYLYEEEVYDTRTYTQTEDGIVFRKGNFIANIHMGDEDISKRDSLPYAEVAENKISNI